MVQIKDKINLKGRTSDPSSPVEGDLYYNSTSKKLKFHNGTSFNEVGKGILLVDTTFTDTVDKLLTWTDTGITRIKVYQSNLTSARAYDAYRINQVSTAASYTYSKIDFSAAYSRVNSDDSFVRLLQVSGTGGSEFGQISGEFFISNDILFYNLHGGDGTDASLSIGQNGSTSFTEINDITLINNTGGNSETFIKVIGFRD